MTKETKKSKKFNDKIVSSTKQKTDFQTENSVKENENVNTSRFIPRKWSFRISSFIFVIVSILVAMNSIFPKCHHPLRKCRTPGGIVWFTSKTVLRI